MIRLVYDGSFEGLLTAVFEVFEYHYADVEIVCSTHTLGALFSEEQEVVTHFEKAERVVKGIEKYADKSAVNQLLKVFLSEDPQRESLILYAVRYLVNTKENIFENYADAQMMRIARLVKSVQRESHRMKAFVRFQKLQDESFFAQIAPDFDVLPLIIKHFKDRYADQKWMIYDLKRGYGIYYDLEEVLPVVPDAATKQKLKNPEAFFHEEERPYEALWKNYFQSVNIKERYNPKLHRQYVPKRYWKYLVEK
ncbi:TIGR03915 family putative DNA repair protein [Capnocytophaga canis]|uniref:TIGR03915 family putative DNA repair protein n=1 Tax=Capnocytophaga canis TaxID=1848903 RepID=UPI0037D082CB